MKKVFVGKIVNTFGIKGELKVSTTFEMPEKVFIRNQKIIINNEEVIITASKIHKGNYLIKINNIDDINLVLIYKNKDIYINYNDLKLNKDEYLMNDLLSLKIMDNDAEVGIVTEVINNKINPLIKINNKFYIPLKSSFINKIDLNEGIIYGNNIKELDLWK